MKDLEHAKVGDTLIIENRDSKRLDTVIKIMPTGNIKCKSGIFYLDGSLRGGGVWNSTHARIASVSDIFKFKKEVKKSRLVSQFHDFNWKTLELETLESIHELINGKL